MALCICTYLAHGCADVALECWEEEPAAKEIPASINRDHIVWRWCTGGVGGCCWIQLVSDAFKHTNPAGCATIAAARVFIHFGLLAFGIVFANRHHSTADLGYCFGILGGAWGRGEEEGYK